MQTGTLRTKFLTRFLPLFLGSFIVLFGICYYLSNQSLTREADVISAQTGRTAALEVEKIFQRQICGRDFEKYGNHLRGPRGTHTDTGQDVPGFQRLCHAGVF